MMDMSDEAMKARCLDWSTGKSSVTSPGYNSHPHITQLSSKIAWGSMLPKESLTLLQAEMLPSPRTNMTALSSYTRQRSTWILQPILSLPIAVRQSRGKGSGKMRFLMRKRCNSIYFILASAQFRDTQIIEIDPSSYLGYQVKHAALQGAQRDDEALEAVQTMLSILENAPDTQTRSKS